MFNWPQYPFANPSNPLLKPVWMWSWCQGYYRWFQLKQFPISVVALILVISVLTVSWVNAVGTSLFSQVALQPIHLYISAADRACNSPRRLLTTSTLRLPGAITTRLSSGTDILKKTIQETEIRIKRLKLHFQKSSFFKKDSLSM